MRCRVCLRNHWNPFRERCKSCGALLEEFTELNNLQLTREARSRGIRLETVPTDVPNTSYGPPTRPGCRTPVPDTAVIYGSSKEPVRVLQVGQSQITGFTLDSGESKWVKPHVVQITNLGPGTLTFQHVEHQNGLTTYIGQDPLAVRIDVKVGGTQLSGDELPVKVHTDFLKDSFK